MRVVVCVDCDTEFECSSNGPKASRCPSCKVSKDREYQREYNKEYERRPEIRQRSKEYHKEYMKDYNKRYSYGLTLEQYEQMRTEHGPLCDVCERSDRELVFDQDHSTGLHRGWLCVGCDTTVGYFGDNVEGLQRVILYCETPRTVQLYSTLSLEQRQELAQSVLECELCGTSDRSLVLDHDHKTDLVRGWLCSPCNLRLGHLGDDIEGVRKAINFLERVECDA